MTRKAEYIEGYDAGYAEGRKARKLDTVDVQGLALVFDAAARNAKVARAFGTGEVIYGTARRVGDTYGANTDVDFRDRYLWVTTTGGFEVFWPVDVLAKEVLRGEFAVDYEPPAPKRERPAFDWAAYVNDGNARRVQPH